jgi:hypothetical protein
VNITYSKLLDIAVEAGIDTDNNVRTDYSGRGMYGKKCVGFDLDSKSELLDLGAALQTEGVLEDFTSRASFDAMGMGIVVYFPGITCDDAPAKAEYDWDEDEDEDS